MIDIHPSAVIDGSVSLADGVKIGPHVYIRGSVEIGKNSTISAGVVIGEPAEYVGAKADHTLPIKIGENVTLREHVVIQRGASNPYQDGSQRRFYGTQIGDNALIMHGCHIAHDCVIENDVRLSPYVVLGGHTVVLEHANMGIGSITHQGSTIGACAMIGMGAVVINDIPTARTAVGNPARLLGYNDKGLISSKLGLFKYLDAEVRFEQYSQREHARSRD